jgi:hypothetical protein
MRRLRSIELPLLNALCKESKEKEKKVFPPSVSEHSRRNKIKVEHFKPDLESVIDPAAWRIELQSAMHLVLINQKQPHGLTSMCV